LASQLLGIVVTVKGQEGNAVPELRKWRANLVANYDFKQNWLKG